MSSDSESRSENVPKGEWVDVKPGQLIAFGTYVDDKGVLRSCGDDSCVVWHHKCKLHRCERKGIQPHQIVYDDNGAPWCPECVVTAQVCALCAEMGENPSGPTDSGS